MGECSRQVGAAHTAYLSNRREPDESNRRDTRPGDIESDTASTASSSGLRIDQLTAKFGEFGLELTQMVARRLVFLGCSRLQT